MTDIPLDDLNGLEIAIIGMAGRFPGARNVDELWHNLRNGIESISFFSVEELEAEGTDPKLLGNANFVRASGVMNGADVFDANFFGYSPREAELMDPQQRVFLECAWQALEDAGYEPDHYDGQIGVYAGSRMSTYLLNIYANQGVRSAVNGLQLVLSNDKDFLTTRTSYKLNLTGPSVTVQSACSTSLVATHLACQGLLSGECDMALAGGVAIVARQKEGYMFREEGISSPDGHCRAFDAGARGTVGGNGVGIVVLKRLETALADGDFIHAVIKGSAINNDGSRKIGFTAPRIEGQAQVIRAAQIAAGVEPESISYIEAHGTGTELGDPIEIAALTRAFRASTRKTGFCAIGSVKTNVGHLDAAAGVTGLIKTVLALKHRQLPPSLHFERPNPKIDFGNSPVYVNARLRDWQANGVARRAGVSSFGMGGTNAHLILEEAPVRQTEPSSRPWKLLLLSAKTSSSLEMMSRHLVNHLKQNPEIELADAAYTLQMGRKVFRYKRAVLCSDANQAAMALQTLDVNSVANSFEDSKERSVVFMFPGQGAQYVNMGLELYQTEPFFREQVDICSELFRPHLKWDLRNALYPTLEAADEAGQQLKQTAIAQPALFTVEYALAKLWMSWGIRPKAMIGHSIGEYVAACLADVMSLEDAVRLVAIRSQLMQQLPSGAMLAVSLPDAEVLPLLDDALSLAAVNGPSLCVVSGPADAVESLQERLMAESISCRSLHTSHAFHSEMMNGMLEAFTREVRKSQLKPPQIPYLSNVTGGWITEADATDADYWARHARQTVRFSEGLNELLKDSNQVLLEVGPGQTLVTLARSHGNRETRQVILATLPPANQQRSDAALLLQTLSRLWLTGVAVDWRGFYAHETRYRIPMPAYAFEQQRYWIEPDKLAGAYSRRARLGQRLELADWFYIPSWKRALSPVPASRPAEEEGCLIFVGESGIGAQIAERLKQAGLDTLVVMQGKEFARLDEHLYQINPAQPDHYDALLEQIQMLGMKLKLIVHEWSVSKEAEEQTDIESFYKWQNQGYYSLLFLLQALAGQNLAQPFDSPDARDFLSIHILSNNLQDVTGEETLLPAKSSILGLCKTIPQEYMNLSCQSIDIDSPGKFLSADRLIQQLTDELLAETEELTIAYRGGHRWVQTYEPVQLTPQPGNPPVLRQKGVYLLNGELDSDSLSRARYLAEGFQARLIFTSRSGLPPKSQWEEWLANYEEHDEANICIMKMQELEELGAEVLVIAADVGNQEDMQAVIKRIDEQFGELHGVIHTPGSAPIETSRPIQELGRTDSESYFHSYVHSTYVLEEVLQGHSLDFCLLISSLASVSGGAGVAAYTAATIFMDSFTQKHNRSNEARWMSLNWESCSAEDAVEAFRRILFLLPATQIVMSQTDLAARLEAWFPPKAFRQFVARETPYARPELPEAYLAPRNEVEQAIADVWQQILGIERIGIEDNFLELGGHSLMALQIITRLRDLFNVELSLRSFLLTPTVAALAESIEAVGWRERQGANYSGATGTNMKESAL
jgi:acyl transferase domain-containing protein